MKRMFVLVAVAAAMLTALALWAAFAFFGQGPGAEEPPRQIEYLIGMSQANLTEPWRITMNRDIERAAQGYGDMRVIFTNASEDIQRHDEVQRQADVRRQISDINTLMGYGIDLLVISPIDGEALKETIAEVYSHIPVIVLDRDVRGDAYTLFIGPDNYKIGYMAGEAVLEMLAVRGGRVLEILGRDQSPPVDERSKGFADAIGGQGGVVVASQLAGNWMQDQAEDRTKEYMIQNPGVIDVVFAHNDAMAYGAHVAMDKLRVEGVRYVGVDGLDSWGGGKDMVRDGTLEATFYCSTGGGEAIDFAYRILSGEKDLPRRLILEPVAITKESLAKEGGAAS